MHLLDPIPNLVTGVLRFKTQTIYHWWNIHNISMNPDFEDRCTLSAFSPYSSKPFFCLHNFAASWIICTFSIVCFPPWVWSCEISRIMLGHELFANFGWSVASGDKLVCFLNQICIKLPHWYCFFGTHFPVSVSRPKTKFQEKTKFRYVLKIYDRDVKHNWTYF